MKKKFLFMMMACVASLHAYSYRYYSPYDINGDMEVNAGDVASLVNLSLMGAKGTTGDLNGDGVVNSSDVSAMVSAVLSGTGMEPVTTAHAFVWDYDAFPELHITISLNEWNRFLNLYDANNKTKEYVVANLNYVKGGERVEIDSIGLRMRGNTSRVRPEGTYGRMHQKDNTDWHHFHIGLKFDKFIDDDAHTLLGVKKLTLKWFKEDPMYVRELFSYDLFRSKGVWTGADDTYARVYIKVEGDTKEAYYGVYNMIEPIDKQFLKRRKSSFGSNKGNLWKCEYGASLRDTNGDFWYDDDKDHTYCLETNEDQFEAAKEQIHDFILKYNNKSYDSFKEWIPTVCDVELLLKTYAVNVALGMWDDYWNNTNNYYIYFNSTDKLNYKFYFIPYDYDNTLGTSANCGAQSDAGRQDPLNWGVGGNPLIRRILDIPEYRAYYVQCLKELAAEGIDYEGSAARIRAWHEKIKDYVKNDTGEDMEIADRPASWGNHGEYRLLEDSQNNNFFRVKCATINAIK